MIAMTMDGKMIALFELNFHLVEFDIKNDIASLMV
jgi:hypothetical protein